jgi:hypothetical protein
MFPEEEIVFSVMVFFLSFRIQREHIPLREHGVLEFNYYQI